ncbi:protein O-mannosyl-transferase TMTC3 [Caerostris extrusa]|uniref:Protein O-mannosyl-transferase TMTC3 n=1 Tax=Caerostris extrusa TaxID=172846 RepID=A0AAV4P5M4_CAEEX|nr:protein O-mannosyl-transferase TMTC3 [Caerostris extrusa]
MQGVILIEQPKVKRISHAYWTNLGRLCLHFLTASSSFLSSALFAVHPIHTEAVVTCPLLQYSFDYLHPAKRVTGVVGRAELLSAIAFLCALLYYIHHRYKQKSNVWFDLRGDVSLSSVSFLCKEQALTVLAVCCIYELSLPKNPSRVQSIRHLMLGRGIVSPWLRDKLLRIFLLCSIGFLALFVRWKFMGQQMPIFSRFDNPASVSSTPIRQLTYNYLLAVNAGLLLFPCNLCCDWTMSTIPLVEGVWDIRNAVTITLYASFFLPSQEYQSVGRRWEKDHKFLQEIFGQQQQLVYVARSIAGSLFKSSPDKFHVILIISFGSTIAGNGVKLHLSKDTGGYREPVPAVDSISASKQSLLSRGIRGGRKSALHSQHGVLHVGLPGMHHALREKGSSDDPDFANVRMKMRYVVNIVSKKCQQTSNGSSPSNKRRLLDNEFFASMSRQFCGLGRSHQVRSPSFSKRYLTAKAERCVHLHQTPS